MSNNFYRNARVQFLAAVTDIRQLEQWLIDHPQQVGIAMVGRSNVGKSSLINALFSKKTARVSNTPGRTQSINIFSFTTSPTSPTFFLYDLPGYGHAKVSKEMKVQWNQLLSMFFLKLPSDVLLLNIQDARHPMQAVDKEFLTFLTHYPQITAYLCLNKFDKLKKQKDRAALTKIIKSFKEEFKTYPLSFKVSAESHFGLDRLHASLDEFLELNAERGERN